MKSSALSTLAFVLAGTVSACSSDDDAPAKIVLGEGKYVVSTTVFDPESQTSYVGVVADPSREAEFDMSRVFEVPGSAALFALDQKRVFALGSSDAPTVVSYELGAGGELRELGRMSLGREGVSSGFKRPTLVPFISDSKAYWLDDLGSQVIVWNPSEMKVGGTFSLEAAARDDYFVEHGAVALRDGLAFVSAAYREANGDGEAGSALVLVLDTDKDELLDVLKDERCGETTSIVRGDDGALYFGSGTIAATLHAHHPDSYPAPCVLRIRAGEREFDPDFKLDFAAITGGRSAGHLVAGEQGRAYVLALHDDLLDEPLGPGTELWAPYEANAWRWWSFDLGAAEPRPGRLIESVDAASAAADVLRAGGRDFIEIADITAGKTRLLVPDADGGLTPGMTSIGFLYGLVELD